jgi:hypothetical protein
MNAAMPDRAPFLTAKHEKRRTRGWQVAMFTGAACARIYWLTDTFDG